MSWIQFVCTVELERGIHGRVATRLAEIAKEFNLDLQVEHHEQRIDCSSILDILSLALVEGSIVRFWIQGERADQGRAAVSDLLSGK